MILAGRCVLGFGNGFNEHVRPAAALFDVR